MALSWISSLVLMTLTVNTYARSMTPRDVANLLPKRSSARLFLPAVAASHMRTQILTSEHTVNAPKESKDTRIPPIAEKHRGILPKQNDQEVHLSKGQDNQRNHIILPAQVKGNVFKVIPPVSDTVMLNDPLANEETTAAPPVSTTLDPWDEFCREACDEGKAGPECDCAEHPIGRRYAPLVEELPQNDLPVLPAVFDGAGVNSQQLQNPVRPVSSTHLADPDVMPSDDGEGEGEQSDGKDSSTTKDPLEQFCDVACKEGVGSVACDCRDHIIG